MSRSLFVAVFTLIGTILGVAVWAWLVVDVIAPTTGPVVLILLTILAIVLVFTLEIWRRGRLNLGRGRVYLSPGVLEALKDPDAYVDRALRELDESRSR